MSSIPLKNLVLLFCVLLVLGAVFTLPIYKFDIRKFMHSSVFIKILFWIPIFTVFVGVLYANNWIRLGVLVLVFLFSLKEFLPVVQKAPIKRILFVYFAIFLLGIAHFYLLATSFYSSFVNILITLCVSTVLADVGAYFLGNYLGKHKLPDALNSKKSWEGVLGEILGALLGVVLVNRFVIPVSSLWLFVPLGVGSAIGDLANSYAKRAANIKDWSHAIPGHGGFIDRLSSMAGSTALLFYFLKLTHLA